MSQRKRILLLEDDKDLSVIIQEVLSDLNVEIKGASIVNEAMDLLESGIEYDLVISSYFLRIGNGMELLRYMAENKYKVPFLFFSHNISYESINYPYFLAVISKFKIERLKLTVQKSLSL